MSVQNEILTACSDCPAAEWCTEVLRKTARLSGPSAEVTPVQIDAAVTAVDFLAAMFMRAGVPPEVLAPMYAETRRASIEVRDVLSSATPVIARRREAALVLQGILLTNPGTGPQSGADETGGFTQCCAEVPPEVRDELPVEALRSYTEPHGLE